ncbi:ATP-binding cassette domain-containing protein [Leucobacter sp. wl10]|uniref:ATP-binding cassette domain-containing protein n=1 Tax=Leucobacter sp. wl10 TaxID=2304677 RepID=UPI000E5A8250|nr:ATP-binding cassette domain-containing protein [Leucobacter sp. wl10]RGE21127.1 ATP-binding cassette domain-containing protein [Leucobacter sp. wl10]
MTTFPEPMLTATSVSRSFGGVKAVDVAEFAVPTGRLTGLIGPNGAGKSTLFNILTGFERADSGAWHFMGEDITGVPGYRIARSGLVRSFQLTRLVPGMSVLENLLLAAPEQPGERLALAGLSPAWRPRENANTARAEELLARVRLFEKRDEDAAGLSGGQRRLLEIARSLMLEPKLLMLDEPLAGVNPALRETVMQHLVELRDEGLTILFIEHDMDAIMNLSDHVICMGGGAVIAVGTPAEVASSPEVVEAYLGKGGTGTPLTVAGASSSTGTEPPKLVVTGIVAGYQPGNPIVNDVSAEVRPGEIVAIIGANGAGKSTLLKAVAGEVRVSEGGIALDGEPIERLPMHRRVDRGIGYVPQSSNVFPSLTVLENLRMGGYAQPRETEGRIAEVLESFEVLKPLLGRLAGSLSGGQRQSVAMARALVGGPRILLLDEPSAGLSPSAQEITFEQVQRIAESGVGVLIVEQNARECLAISDRAYVLEQGRVALTGTGPELLHDERVIELYLGSLRTGGGTDPRNTTTDSEGS